VIPAIGPLSRVVLLVIGAVVAMAAAGFYVVTTKLDYQALNLGSLVAPALLPVIATVLAILAYGPLARVRERIPARGALAAGGAVVAAILPVIGLRAPSDEVKAAVVDRSYVGGRMVAAIRKVWDRDHDGYSPFFGGPDCDDHDPNRHLRAMDGSCLDVDGPPPDGGKVVTPTPVDAAAPAAEPALAGGDNVLIIFIDTLRFDRLGVAGYQREGKSLTPRIDQFAQQAVVFRKAYAQAPNTPRSVPSFWTSQYPSQVKFDSAFLDYSRVLDENDTLFEALKPAGFKTIGETSHFFFCNRKRDPSSCDKVYNTNGKLMDSNIDQGADEWDNKDALDIPGSNHDIAGPRIVKKTIAKLDELAQSKQKFAMLVHLFEPHSTYMVHNGYTYKEHGPAGLAEKYDYEIAFEDGLVGQLLDELDKTGLAKNTTVVVMADHGEGFGSHTIAGQQDFFHGETLYQVVLHVPLMFRVPGGKPCTRDDVVELIDLAPTVAALFKVTPPKSWVGRSLMPALECKAMPPKPAFAQMLKAPAWKHEGVSMIDGDRHVYNQLSNARVEIYDVEKDPDETSDLAKSDPNAKELDKKLLTFHASHPM
jgi:choline-sulfatase